MITLFTIPKPFKGHIGIIQENAIMSWKKATPGVNIVVYGNEEGIAGACEKYELTHVPEIPRNEFGTPTLDFVFEHASNIPGTEYLIYINGDIMLVDDLNSVVSNLRKNMNGEFLLCGRRIDVDIKERIDVSQPSWKEVLMTRVQHAGVMHGYSGIDYFLFPVDFSVRLKSFAVGRPGWDNWFIRETLTRKIPVIDATEVIMAIHQNHPPAYNLKMTESQRNVALVGDMSQMANLRNADFRLTVKGVKKFRPGRRLVKFLFGNRITHALITYKRKLYYLKNKR